MRASAAALVIALAACSPTVGTECDQTAAHAIVYDPVSGSPAYAGQSLLITSCSGGGSFCHASTAIHRYGAPFGTDLDPLLADGAAGNRERLVAARVNAYRLRDDIFARVSRGADPPGALGASLEREHYRAFADDTDVVGTPLPGIRTADGREILRNWLACQTPVVERTTDPPPVPCATDADCPLTHCDQMAEPALRQCYGVGFVVPRRAVAITPTWDSLYANVLGRSCALGGCHDRASAASSGALDLSAPAVAYAGLVGATASDVECGVRVVPGDPDGSALIAVLTGASTCTTGGPFHQTTTAVLDALRAWIASGATME